MNRLGSPRSNRIRVRLPMVAVACWSLCGWMSCGDDAGQDSCPEGFEVVGSSCAPIFDDCTGPAEISVLGGGCQQVGVTTCATDLFKSDGEGGCEPILPPGPGPDPCPPGTMEFLGQTACEPVGVTQCAGGFEVDGEGGCTAVLPPDAAPCPAGSLTVLGHTVCQPVDDCGAEPWGNLVDDPSTVYVDQTADATGADGSQQAPYPTVGEALAVVSPGGQVAVAAGDYEERLTLGHPARITGRCSTLVTLRGRVFLGDPKAPLTISDGGAGSELRGVTLTGPGEGLVLDGATQVIVERVEVVDTAGYGLSVTGEAEVSLSRVKIVGSTAIGIFAEGGTVSLSECVVRNTRSRADETLGRGINAQCATSASCGGLTVSRSLILGNREAGIFTGGVDAIVTDSVVRDTLPRESNRILGQGISAECHPDAARCGSITVIGCHIAGNRSTGISVAGPDAWITDTVVRDTLPQESDQQFGPGIGAKCNTALAVCGELSVTTSLIAENHGTGIAAAGVSTTITSTIVRDTLPQPSDSTRGNGIDVECDSLVGTCGTVSIERSLITDNGDLGISLSGVDATITASVVRDTQPSASDGTGGRGIGAQCHAVVPSCGSLRVHDSLVTGNATAGITAFGVETAVRATVVSRTGPRTSDWQYGRGIVAHCDPERSACGGLNVTGSWVYGNRGEGILAAGVDTTITDTTVLHTLPQQSDGKFGRGINVQCHPEAGTCGSLTVRSSTVRTSQNAAIFIAGVPATLHGVAVLDTGPNDMGVWADEYGQGIWALCDDRVGVCAALQMTSCLLDSSYNAGLAVLGVSGQIQASVIRQVAPQLSDNKYGYGIQLEGLEEQSGSAMPTFDVIGCEIRDARLAGILYYRAQGTLTGSAVSGAENSVIMNEGSSPTIQDDNALFGTVENEPTWAGMYPSPAPPPALPQPNE
ncbi:MAG: right-handed parallel beta-helix repeat-containing protein [bacterium]